MGSQTRVWGLVGLAGPVGSVPWPFAFQNGSTSLNGLVPHCHLAPAGWWGYQTPRSLPGVGRQVGVAVLENPAPASLRHLGPGFASCQL